MREIGNPVHLSPSDPKKLGLACPRCGCQHLPVIYTRRKPGYILRLRECRHCGRRVRTREQG